MFNKIGGYLFNDTIYLKTMEVMSIFIRTWTIKRKASPWLMILWQDDCNHYLKANSSSLGMIPIHLLVQIQNTNTKYRSILSVIFSLIQDLGQKERGQKLGRSTNLNPGPTHNYLTFLDIKIYCSISFREVRITT